MSESLRPATLLKKALWHRCFPVSFVKFLRIPFYIEHLWWLLLNIADKFKKLIKIGVSLEYFTDFFAIF